MSIKKTYFSEALIGEEAKKKLGLIIKDGAITTNKMKDNTVTTYKIVDKAVTEPKLADNSVSERTIQMSAVSHDKLAIDAVAKENIRDNAITTRAIDKQAVTHDKMSNGAIGSENIMADAVKEEHIASNAVSTDELQDGSVTLRKLAHDATDVIDGFRTELNELKVKHDKDIQRTLTEALNAAKDAKENPVIKNITSEQIKDGEIKTVDICDGAVTTEKIAADSITEEKIKTGAVSTDEIQDGSVTYRKLSHDVTDLINDAKNDISGLKTKHKTDVEALEAKITDAKNNPVIPMIGSDKIADKSILTRHLADGAVNKEQIAANAITEEKIAAGAVSTDEIQDGCITFEKLSPDLLKRLLEEVATVKVDGQVVFMHNYTGKELPVPTSAGLYAYSNNNLYKSDGVGTYTWNRSASEAGKIYVDEDTAQSYVSDGHGNLLRLDKENSDLSFEVIG